MSRSTALTTGTTKTGRNEMKYHYGWYVVPFPNNEELNEYEWLEKTMGEPGDTKRWFMSVTSASYYFKKESDALLFELGWGLQ